MSKRDTITALLLARDKADSRAPMEYPRGNLTPEEKAQLEGRPPPPPVDMELEQWTQQMGEQMPPRPPATVMYSDVPGAITGVRPERMPQVFRGEQTAPMPNYAQQVPPRDFGSIEYPAQPEPSFEGQWSGEVPQSW